MTPGTAHDGPTRRAVLVGVGSLAGSALLGGCTGDDTAPEPPAPDPDAEPLRRARASEQRLQALYAAASARLPAQAERFDAVLGEHAAHLEALDAVGSASTPPAPSPPAPTPAASALPVALPAGQAALLRRLAQEESAAADERAGDLVAATPAVRRLLASIGASEASHAALLRRAQA